MPVDINGVAVDRSVHCGSWHRSLSPFSSVTCMTSRIDSDANSYSPDSIFSFLENKSVNLPGVVQDIMNMFSKHAKKVAHALDPHGRLAINIAPKSYIDVIKPYLYYYRRYEIVDGPPEHQSATCIVRIATLHPLDSSEEERQVALKFMKNPDQFERELIVREKYNLDPSYVLNAITQHNSDEDPEYKKEVEKSEDYHAYPYLLVLPRADRNLGSMLVHERFAGRDMQMVRLISEHIAKGLLHMEEKGLIHGDIKPLNIMRQETRYMLIDLDATVIFDFLHSFWSRVTRLQF